MENRRETEKTVDQSSDDRNEDADEEEKMEMFFTLIRNYQRARKRRREELGVSEDRRAEARRSDGERSNSRVPLFRSEDFAHAIEFEKSPIVIPAPVEGKEGTEKTDKGGGCGGGGLDLDLNLAL